MPLIGYILIFGLLSGFSVMVVIALSWSMRTGGFSRMARASRMIFDTEEPEGMVTDGFPGEKYSGGKFPDRRFPDQKLHKPESLSQEFPRQQLSCENSSDRNDLIEKKNGPSAPGHSLQSDHVGNKSGFNPSSDDKDHHPSSGSGGPR